MRKENNIVWVTASQCVVIIHSSNQTTVITLIHDKKAFKAIALP